MKNGVPLRCDPDLRDFLLDIQKQRIENKLDKSRKSLTKLSTLAYKILRLNKNTDRMLSGRC